MQRRFGRFALVVAVSSALLLVAPGSGQADVKPTSPRHKMLMATNWSRSSHALRTLRINRSMSELARDHSLAMARSGTLFHTNNPGRYYLKGLNWSYWGENVGVTGGTVGDLESAFMASTPHRENILHSGFRHVAIGAVRVDGVLWVTVFFYN